MAAREGVAAAVAEAEVAVIEDVPPSIEIKLNPSLWRIIIQHESPRLPTH